MAAVSTNDKSHENSFNKQDHETEDDEETEIGVGGERRKGHKKSSSISERDRKIGHRRVNDVGEVSYKKIQTNTLMGSIQLGIQFSIGAAQRYDDRDLLMQDFMTIEATSFPKSGGSQTPAHSYSDFTFKAYAPLAFRFFRKLFGIQSEDFLMSLCHEQLRELSNPGASGSIFYLTNDDEFILKTVQHKEAEFLQKLLPGYYMNLNQNPHTLLPKFFGMFCYQCNQKNIRLTVMNNLLPSQIKMHLKFDLKGSTYKRKASKHERAKNSPTYKDLDFVELLPEGLLLERETYDALISTLRRDCRVLESFRIMDYSLLIGIHNLDLAAKERAELTGGTSPNPVLYHRPKRLMSNKQRLIANSTAMEAIQAIMEPIDMEEHLPPGGIPARNHKGERLLLFLGIIDILQSYRIRKKLEHTIKSIIHDGDTISVHRPGFYAHRFLDFMADKVFKKVPSPLKHSPSKRSKRESVKKMSESKNNDEALAASTAASSQQNNGQDKSPPSIPFAAASVICGAAVGAGAVAVGGGAAPPPFDGEGGNSQHPAETLNLPAVLWDRPAGSRTRVPPPVPPRSPKRPNAPDSPGMADPGPPHKPRSGGVGQPLPHRPDLSGRNSSKHSSRQHSGSTSDAVSVSDVRLEPSDAHGTPSRLSVGGTSGGWNTPTPTWTEGTPSYTESTYSGEHLGNTPIRSLDALKQDPSTPVVKSIATASYQETEM